MCTDIVIQSSMFLLPSFAGFAKLFATDYRVYLAAGLWNRVEASSGFYWVHPPKTKKISPQT